jgi:outer membrane autotransporter protein
MATPFEQPKMTLKPVFLSNEKSHIWIQPYGGLNRLKSYDQVTGLSFKTAGTAFGVGHYVSENIIMGVLTGGSISSYSQDFSNGTGDIDAGYLGIYGGYEKSEGGLNIDGSVTYGQSRYTSERNISALGLTAKGSHRGWDGSGRVRLGYKVYSGNSSVDPFVELGYRYSYEGSYQENNAGAFNLSVPSSTGKAVDIEIGARFEHTMLVNEVLVKPLIGISALRENPIDKKTNANLGFTDTGNLFSVPISNEIKTYATATIGCVAMFTNNVTLSALATGKARKHETGAELVLKASYAF